MTKWEYLVVVPQLAGETIRPRFVDGKELEDWEEGPGLPECLGLGALLQTTQGIAHQRIFNAKTAKLAEKAF